MTKPKIFILSGPVQSGKTSRLLKWCEGRNDVAGILTPDIDGKRYFMDVAEKEIFPMEAADGETDVLNVGKYTFSKTSFDKAAEILLRPVQNAGWIIIDEAGPLELKGKGLSEPIKRIISAPADCKIILIVREHLFQSMLEYFHIDQYKFFNE